jgi:hypothetical protein
MLYGCGMWRAAAPSKIDHHLDGSGIALICNQSRLPLFHSSRSLDSPAGRAVRCWLLNRPRLRSSNFFSFSPAPSMACTSTAARWLTVTGLKIRVSGVRFCPWPSYVADYRSGKKAALYNVSRFQQLDVRKLFQALIQVTVGDVEAAKSLVQLV